MRRGKTIIFLSTIVFLAIVVLCLRMDPQDLSGLENAEEKTGISLLVSADGNTEEITLWKNDAGEYCAFLPGYARLPQVQLKIDYGCSVRLEGQLLTDGMSCDGFSPEEPYQLAITKGREPPSEIILRFYCAGSLPAVYVDVRSGNMTYIHGYKDNEESGSMRIYLPDGQLHYSGSLESVKGRGNATWEWEKKSYNLKLRSEADLLDMGQASNWVLLSNVYDPSHIRNKIVYETAARLDMAYSPQSRWVDLYLNGAYAGLYLLCEKNEIHPQRVDLDPEAGNLISIEKQDRLWEYSNSFLTEGGIPIRIRSTADTKAVQEKLKQLEGAVLAPDGIDPETGRSWTELIDVESWAKKYLIEEVFGNLDAGSISQFFYWQDNGKIFAGPVWDYDVTMGRPGTWQMEDVNMLYSGRPHLWSPEDTPWYYALYQKEAFRERVTALYRDQLRPLVEEMLDTGIGMYRRGIAQSARMNQLRWQTDDPQAAAEQIVSYMRQRLEFLDSMWLEQAPYCMVQKFINWHVMACYAVAPGETLPEWEVYEGTDTIRYIGWYHWETGEPFDFSEPITENTLVYLKEEGSEESGPAVSSGGLSAKIQYLPLAAMLVLLSVSVVIQVLRSCTGRNRRQND